MPGVLASYDPYRGLPIYLLEEEWGNTIKRIGRIGHQIQAALIINSFMFCVIGSAVEEFIRMRSFNLFSTMYLRYLKDLIFIPFLRFTYPDQRPGSSSPASIPPYIIAGSFIRTARFWHYNIPLDAV